MLRVLTLLGVKLSPDLVLNRRDMSTYIAQRDRFMRIAPSKPKSCENSFSGLTLPLMPIQMLA